MRFLLFLSLLLAPLTAHAQECLDQTPCVIGDRSYHVRLPDDWDGVTPMPVMLHFHGWARQGTLVVRHQRIASATAPRGVLLLAPNGRHRSWDFWNAGSGDVTFARAVLEDAASRYPIDRENVFVSGYSFGSAMAWRFVCEDGADVRALLAVSGTLRQDEDCATAPREVFHVHGLKDNVMDFPFGPGGDTLYPVQLWRDKMACVGAPSDPVDWQVRAFLTFSQYRWLECDAGDQVTLDLHPGGHFIPHGWFAAQLDVLLGTLPES